MRYFEVEDRLESKFSPAVPKWTNIRRPGACDQCGTLPQDSGPPEALHVNGTPGEEKLSSTSWGFGVISIELLDLLGDEARQCLRLGRLANPDGKVLEGVRTFVAVEEIVLRGDRSSEHRVCKACGALVYTYQPRSKPYVTEPQVASRRPIYGIESMRLMVSETLRERIGQSWSNLLLFHEVPVLPTANDGLAVDIGLWPTEAQLVGYRPNVSKFMQR